MGGTINTMILGGLALAFSRVIDNSVISLENIYRHLEMGTSPEQAAEDGGAGGSLAVLAATLTTVVVFLPGDFPLRREQVSLYGVGSGSGDFAVCLLLRGHDRDSADSARYLHKPEAQSSQKGGRGEIPRRIQPGVYTPAGFL